MVANIAAPRCGIDGCNDPAQARGVCSAHYARWYRETNHGERERPAGLSSTTFREKVGISLRELDYWTTTGVIRPSSHRSTGQGDPHRWTEADVHDALVVKALRDGGMSLDAVRPMVREARERLLTALLEVQRGGES